MKDQRAASTFMPEEGAAVVRRLIDLIKPQIEASFDEILALPGAPVERENDALSMFAEIGGFVALQLAGRLMAKKRVDPESAMAAAIHTISERMTGQFVELIFGGGR